MIKSTHEKTLNEKMRLENVYYRLAYIKSPKAQISTGK